MKTMLRTKSLFVGFGIFLYCGTINADDIILPGSTCQPINGADEKYFQRDSGRISNEGDIRLEVACALPRTKNDDIYDTFDVDVRVWNELDGYVFECYLIERYSSGVVKRTDYDGQSSRGWGTFVYSLNISIDTSLELDCKIPPGSDIRQLKISQMAY